MSARIEDQSFPRPSLSDVIDARARFREVEPRGLFYRAATELVALAREGKIGLELAEAIAVLLQTWNATYYRFSGKLDESHVVSLSRLIKSYGEYLSSVRERSIRTLTSDDTGSVQQAFQDFEKLLGPVGAAKTLHLLAPTYFPLWDNEIASRFGCRLTKRGSNGQKYCSFMLKMKEQVSRIFGNDRSIADPLKALDEWSYCRFTLPMLERKRTQRANAPA